MKRPLSCFIIARNEADRISRTIASVRDLVDEVVVVDSGSTDGTQAIAEAAGARVIFNTWPGFGQQKRFAEMQCRHDWLLNLDADEVVTPDGLREIEALFATGEPRRAGYMVDVSIIYPGHAKPRPFARDHRCVRLYDRRRMRYADSTLLDRVEAGPHTLGTLRHALHHHSVRSFDDLIAKCDERASYNAGNIEGKRRSALGLRVLTEMPSQFLKYYLGRTHVFGGLAGFQFAAIVAFYRFVRVVRLREGLGDRDLDLNRTDRRASTPAAGNE